LRRSDGALTATRAVLRNLLVEIEDNMSGTIDEIDTEFLHDLRVALRRTRSVLTECRRLLPADVATRFRTGFAQLAGATSRARDLDVYLLDLPRALASLQLDDPSTLHPLRSELEAHCASAHAELREVLESADTRTLLEGWRTWLDDPAPDHVDHDAGTIGPFIADRIRKAQRGLLRDGRAIDETSPPEHLHDLRKDAKKLRYLFECFGSVLPDKPRRTFVAQLKSLQDNLGAHQDAEVQVAELRTIAHDLSERRALGVEGTIAVGRLIDQLEAVRRRERSAFAQRFAGYDTAANRKLLDTILAKADGG
jgi:CHAD domain-containing protein